MKNKLITIGIIFSLILTGCSQKNKQNITEPTSDTPVSITQQEEQQKDKTDISIFTKDEEIKYEKFVEEEKYDTMLVDFMSKLEQDKLPQLQNNEKIRIEFTQQLPKDKEVSIQKMYLKQDIKDTNAVLTDTQIIQVNENGYVDFEHSYNDKDKYLEGIIYEVTAQWEDVCAKYAFAFKVDNKSVTNNNPYEVTGYLSSDQQKIYDNYKKDKNIEVFKNIEPLTMVKYYAQAIMEEEYGIAYTLYKHYDTENITEQNYIKAMKSFSKEQKEDYISNLKAATNGKFVEDTKEKGYIEYEIQQDHPMAIDMIKDNNGVWKIQYIPVE